MRCFYSLPYSNVFLHGVKSGALIAVTIFSLTETGWGPRLIKRRSTIYLVVTGNTEIPPNYLNILIYSLVTYSVWLKWTLTTLIVSKWHEMSNPGLLSVAQLDSSAPVPITKCQKEQGPWAKQTLLNLAQFSWGKKKIYFKMSSDWFFVVVFYPACKALPNDLGGG